MRLDDNRALFEALQSGFKVLPVFIFDTLILEKLQNKEDARVQFIYDQVSQLNERLKAFQSGIRVFHSSPETALRQLIEEYNVKAVYLNKDYEPYAIKRDMQIEALCAKNQIGFKAFKDQVVFEENEIVKDDGLPYTVFTPYSKKWKNALNEQHLAYYSIEKLVSNFFKIQTKIPPDLNAIGFKPSPIEIPEPQIKNDVLQSFADNRNLPAKDATTKLGVHLRFGTVSTRQLVKKALITSEVFLNELIWREFFYADFISFSAC